MRLMHKLIAAAAGAGAVLLFAGPAAASVTFNAADGTGFVGKGDVQIAFGWNNPTLQNNASGVSFSSSTVDTYSATCEWTTGVGTKGQKTHDVTQTRNSTVDSAIGYDTRVKTQITGFKLTGYGSATTTGEAPTVGGTCIGDGANGTWVSVVPTGSESHLFVKYGGTSVPLN